MNNFTKSMGDEGRSHKNQEYWTTIGGRKIYARSLEALYRTVAYGWIQHKEKCICMYCGKEWYDMSMPCECNKGDTAKRKEAMKRLNDIETAQKKSQSSTIIIPK